MKTPFKSIKLWADEKTILTDAFNDVIENVYGRNNDMSRIYKDILDKLDKSLMVKLNGTDGTHCYIDIYGGEYDACIFALKRVKNPTADKLLSKIRTAPDKTKVYY